MSEKGKTLREGAVELVHDFYEALQQYIAEAPDEEEALRRKTIRSMINALILRSVSEAACALNDGLSVDVGFGKLLCDTVDTNQSIRYAQAVKEGRVTE